MPPLTPFPRKLFDLIEAEPNHLIQWSDHGKSFMIHDENQFCVQVLPKYFRHTRLTSFQRQLNLYGFRRLTKGPDNGAYYHPLFRKDGLDDITTMKRIIRKLAPHRKSRSENELPRRAQLQNDDRSWAVVYHNPMQNPASTSGYPSPNSGFTRSSLNSWMDETDPVEHELPFRTLKRRNTGELVQAPQPLFIENAFDTQDIHIGNEYASKLRDPPRRASYREEFTRGMIHSRERTAYTGGSQEESLMMPKRNGTSQKPVPPWQLHDRDYYSVNIRPREIQQSGVHKRRAFQGTSLQRRSGSTWGGGHEIQGGMMPDLETEQGVPNSSQQISTTKNEVWADSEKWRQRRPNRGSYVEHFQEDFEPPLPKDRDTWKNVDRSVARPPIVSPWASEHLRRPPPSAWTADE